MSDAKNKSNKQNAPGNRDRRRKGTTFVFMLIIGLAVSGCGPNRFEKRPPAWGSTLPGALEILATNAGRSGMSEASDTGSPVSIGAWLGDRLEAPTA